MAAAASKPGGSSAPQIKVRLLDERLAALLPSGQESLVTALEGKLPWRRRGYAASGRGGHRNFHSKSAAVGTKAAIFSPEAA